MRLALIRMGRTRTDGSTVDKRGQPADTGVHVCCTGMICSRARNTWALGLYLAARGPQGGWAPTAGSTGHVEAGH
jgi:hypothetical protein